MPMEDQKAHTISEHLVKKVYTKYGPPERIKTTSYHPKTDGLVERFNRTLCDMLACYVTDEPECCDKYLNSVTFAEPIIPSDIPSNKNIEVFEDGKEEYEKQWQRALERSQKRLAQAQERQKQLYDQGRSYKINRQISDVNYEILILREDSKDLEDEAKFIVHVNKLKLVSNTPNEQLKVPNTAKVIKRRGRPPKVVHVPKRRGRPPSTTKKDEKSQPKRRVRPPKIQEIAKLMNGDKQSCLMHDSTSTTNEVVFHYCKFSSDLEFEYTTDYTIRMLQSNQCLRVNDEKAFLEPCNSENIIHRKWNSQYDTLDEEISAFLTDQNSTEFDGLTPLETTTKNTGNTTPIESSSIYVLQESDLNQDDNRTETNTNNPSGAFGCKMSTEWQTHLKPLL
uniref:Integrase catalytic domain-containing protein n=1 Tax=Daphnia galeata TaxID=27404 RepID=A0A8J2RY39_9CRUS|nr:unnamed protein product [Daphnia galeata]